MKKIIKDTLQFNGKWSRKSLSALICFVMSILVGAFIVLSDYLIEGEINHFAISVFYGFLGCGMGTLGLTVIDKIKNKKSNDSNSI